MKKHYEYIDLLKSVAIFFVILIHNYGFNTDFIVNGGFNTYLAYFVRLFIEGVLIFVFVNGFLLSNKQVDLKKHLIKIFKILFLVIIWSIFFVVIFSFINHEIINFKHIVSNVLLTDITSKYSGILWFLQNLICLYLIYPVLKVCKENNKTVYNYIFIVVMIFTVGSNLVKLILQIVSAICHMNNITNWIGKFIESYNPVSNGYFILYFMFGGYVAENIKLVEKYKKKIYIGGICSMIVPMIYSVICSKITTNTYYNNFNYNTIFMMMFVLFIFTLTYNYKFKTNFLKKYICFVGKNSLGIYFTHVIVLKVLNIYLINESWYILLNSCLVLFISSILVYVISKIPILKNFIKI